MIATKAVERNLPKEMIKGFLNSLSIQLRERPEDIAEVAAFLSSPAAYYYNGGAVARNRRNGTHLGLFYAEDIKNIKLP